MQIPILVEICSPLCFRNRSILIMPWFPANHIAVFAGMQYLVPMRPATVAPNCVRATTGIVAPASFAATASLRHGVEASHRFGELFVGRRWSCNQCCVSKRFADVSCWTVFLLLVAASAKLFNNPARASIKSCTAGSMARFSARLNSLSVASARWWLTPLAYVAR